MLRARVEPRPKLRLIRGGRGQKPTVINEKAFLRSLQGLSREEAMRFVVDQANSHISRSGIYRVKRLFIPGDVSISPITGCPGYRYKITVRDQNKHILVQLSQFDMSHAILDLLSFWEAEEPTLGPGIS